jgi:hypothetical protein
VLMIVSKNRAMKINMRRTVAIPKRTKNTHQKRSQLVSTPHHRETLLKSMIRVTIIVHTPRMIHQYKEEMMDTYLPKENQ